MVLSGWILPNMVDSIECRSYSNHKEHILAVQNYLETLDATSLAKITSKANQLGISSYDDIAVLLLGWIKVINYPYKTICYIAREDSELVIQKYMKLGYLPTEFTPKHFMG